MVTPATGLLETVPAPRHAVGPELTQLFVGSEGTLGVITQVTLQVVPLPEARRFAAVAFPTVGAGIGAIRRALQLGHRPSVVRLYDEEATRLAGPDHDNGAEFGRLSKKRRVIKINFAIG